MATKRFRVIEVKYSPTDCESSHSRILPEAATVYIKIPTLEEGTPHIFGNTFQSCFYEN